MNILHTIADSKRAEVAVRKRTIPTSVLEQSIYFYRDTLSLSRQLQSDGSSGIIAEFKRKSPSKGILNHQSLIQDVTTGYVNAGAAGLSVLTDHPFFGGTSQDLLAIRDLHNIPILRKDFIIDPYQILEAKSIGADVILLIAALLTPEETLSFARLAKSLGMESILEIHSGDEMSRMNDQISILGVNNRNLVDFSVTLDISLSLSEFITDSIPFISESGIHHPSDVDLLRKAGYKGFLIGEQFMVTANPAAACQSFISGLNPGRSL